MVAEPKVSSRASILDLENEVMAATQLADPTPTEIMLRSLVRRMMDHIRVLDDIVRHDVRQSGTVFSPEEMAMPQKITPHYAIPIAIACWEERGDPVYHIRGSYQDEGMFQMAHFVSKDALFSGANSKNVLATLYKNVLEDLARQIEVKASIPSKGPLSDYGI